MKVSKTCLWLGSLTAALALAAAAIGTFSPADGAPFSFLTLHGEATDIFGQGLYRYDTPLTAIGFKVADVITLLMMVPLLVVGLVFYRRGSLRGGLLLAGTFAYFLYSYGSMALGAAYNILFLVYISLMSCSLFGLAASLRSFDPASLPARFSQDVPRRGIGVFLIVSGAILLSVWFLMSLLPAMLAGGVPSELGPYTTVVTFVIDMGIIAPLFIHVGRMWLRRDALAFLLVPVLLVLTSLLGIQLAAMGTVQFSAGLFGIGQFIGMVISFMVLTVFAIRYAILLLRDLTAAADS